MLLCCYVRRGACERLLRFLDDAEKRLETFRCAVTALLACLKSFSPDGDGRAGLKQVENPIQAVLQFQLQLQWSRFFSNLKKSGKPKRKASAFQSGLDGAIPDRPEGGRRCWIYHIILYHVKRRREARWTAPCPCPGVVAEQAELRRRRHARLRGQASGQ
jgi:hypothetical protein